MRLLLARSFALGLTLALACAEETPEDPDLRAACDAQCAAEIACEDTTLTMSECSNSCVADVGFPGDACHDAIQVLAACISDHCGDMAACATQLADRSQHCGGTG